MEGALDASAIQRELDRLRQERQQERERLSGMAPGGRGRGAGPWGGGVRGSEGLLGGRPGRPVFMGSRLGGGPPGAGPLQRGGSGGGSGAFGRLLGAGSLERTVSSSSARSGRDESTGGGGGGSLVGRKRLLSAVVVDGEARTALQRSDHGDEPMAEVGGHGEYDGTEEPPPKRPARDLPAADAKRSRRLLGGLLLGTLQKFREEEAVFRTSKVAQQRQEVERRTAEKERAEEVRLREEARKERAERRAESLSKLRNLGIKQELLTLELHCAEAIKRRQLLAGYLATAPTGTGAAGEARGALLWVPKVHNDATAALAAARVEEFEQWREAALKQLEADKLAAEQRAEERAAAVAKRYAEQQAARQAQQEAGHVVAEQEEGDEEVGGSDHEGEPSAGDGMADADDAAPVARHQNGHADEPGGRAEGDRDSGGRFDAGVTGSGVDEPGDLEPDYEEDDADEVGPEMPGSVEDLLR